MEMRKRWVALVAIIAFSSRSSWAWSTAESKEFMNTSVDPCVDFDAFACGRFAAKYKLRDGQHKINMFTIMNEKVMKDMKDIVESPEVRGDSRSELIVREMYKICNSNYSSPVQDLKQIIKGVGNWPLMGSNWLADEYDLTSLLAKVAQVVTPLFQVSVKELASTGATILIISKDDHISLEHIFKPHLTPRGATNTFALGPDDFEKLFTFAQGAGAIISKEAFMNDLQNILSIERHVLNAVDVQNFGGVEIKLNDLNQAIPQVDWPRYFKMVAPTDVHSYLDSNPNIVLQDASFLFTVTSMLMETNPRDITNYVISRYVFSLFRTLAMIDPENFYAIPGEDRNPRWETCLAIISNILPSAYGALYISKHFKEETRGNMNSIIDPLMDAFINILEESIWMTNSETKQKAIHKARNMARVIGYPEWIKDGKLLDSRHDGIVIEPSDSFIAMLDKLKRWKLHFSFKALLDKSFLLKRSDRVNAAVINAYNFPAENRILFPAAFLQPPLFSPDYPAAVLFGGMGSIIGHEITHGFDDFGKNFDSNGTYSSWWDEVTSQKFDNKSECLVLQYSNVTVPNTIQHVDGKDTLGENIADNGGVKEAFLAYQKYLEKNVNSRSTDLQYTDDQLFFITYAQNWCENMQMPTVKELTDNHSPNKHRTLAVLSNRQEFATAFHCDAGTPMNPEHKCAVWRKR